MTTPTATALAVNFQPDWWQVLQAPFMRNALLGGTIVALAAGLIGYFVILRGSAFASHALAHIGFPGATGAVLLGLPVTVGLLTFTIAGALAIGALGKRASQREIATGSVLAFATALGVLFSSLTTSGSSTLTNVLFGNLLAIAPDQLILYAVIMTLLTAALAGVYRPLLYASIDPDVAEAKGVPIRALGVTFMLLLAVVVTMSVQVVGVLLLFALVVTPAAAALHLTARPARVITLSAAISAVSVWVGLILAAMFNLPPSFFIVTCATLTWAITKIRSTDRRKPSTHPRQTEQTNATDPGPEITVAATTANERE